MNQTNRDRREAPARDSGGTRATATANNVKDSDRDITVAADITDENLQEAHDPVAEFNEAVSKMGRVAIELLVVTNCPDNAPLRAVVCIGPLLERKFVVSSVSS